MKQKDWKVTRATIEGRGLGGQLTPGIRLALVNHCDGGRNVIWSFSAPFFTSLISERYDWSECDWDPKALAYVLRSQGFTYWPNVYAQNAPFVRCYDCGREDCVELGKNAETRIKEYWR